MSQGLDATPSPIHFPQSEYYHSATSHSPALHLYSYPFGHLLLEEQFRPPPAPKELFYTAIKEWASSRFFLPTWADGVCPHKRERDVSLHFLLYDECLAEFAKISPPKFWDRICERGRSIHFFFLLSDTFSHVVILPPLTPTVISNWSRARTFDRYCETSSPICLSASPCPGIAVFSCQCFCASCSLTV